VGRGRGPRHQEDLGVEYARAVGATLFAATNASARPRPGPSTMRCGHRAGRQRVVEVALTPEQAPSPLFGIISNGTHIVDPARFSDDTYAESVAHSAAGRVPVSVSVSERCR